jgi:dUTP pyrophosphatase
MKPLTIQIKKLNAAAQPPQFATEQAAGMDLAACLDEPRTIAPHSRALVPTGFAIALSAGYEAQIRGRSGLALKHGVMPANGLGTIDADYRGEVGVILLNSSDEPFVVEPGMRIAQMVIARYEYVQWSEVDELDETDRSSGGFGSTGQ